MRTKFSKKQIEILEKIDEIISEIRQCELKYDKEIIFDLCLNGELALDFHYENESEKMSENLIELISEMAIKLDEMFQDFEEKEMFVFDIIYMCFDRFVNNYKLSIIRSFYQENKTGKYANLIINVLKEAQFIDIKLNHVYVNNYILERIMLSGEICLYDEFGVSYSDLHKKFILACNDFHNQFKKDYPSMLEYNSNGKNYYTTNSGVKRFIRNTINNIVKYLEIEVKKQPIFINLDKSKKSFNNNIYLCICIGKKLGKCVYRDSYELDKEFKKSELKKITSEIEEIINSVDSKFDLDFVLDVVEEKLGIAA